MGVFDWIILGVFFLAMIGIIAYVLMQKEKDTTDYFLAGKDAGWISIGSSIFASNIGSEHLVGLAGVGFISGMAMAHWEIQAWIILLLGWVFVPFYDRIKIFTMPEYLEKRFSAGNRTILSLISLVSYVLTKVAVTVYAGGVVFKEVFGIESIWGIDFFWISAIGLVLVTGIYTVLGGMKAVMYTSVLQSPVLLAGSVFILIIGLSKVGGWAEVQNIAGHNIHLIRPAGDAEFPWPGVIVASMVIGFWYWCTDQFIVQRVLSGRNQREARRGAILGGYFKLLPVFIFLIPGMIAFALSQKGMLNVSSSDSAFAAMVSQLLPAGFKGVVVCGLLAALMSSLASLFNSSAALFVGDFYKKFRPGSSEQHLLVVGRIATASVVILGVVWIPVMLGLGKVLYDYLQAVQGLLAPAIATVFILGVFWKRTSAKGALWGMIIGFAIGMFRLALHVTLGAKASLVMEARKLTDRIHDVTGYTHEILLNNLHAFSEKIGNVLSVVGEAMQNQVQDAAASLAVITPESQQHAFQLLSQVSSSLDTLFTNQYGILFRIASVNSYVFTALLFIFCVLLVVVISLLTKAPGEKQMKYTMAAATAEEKAITRASWNKWDVIHTAIILGIVALFYFYFW
jgi:SSS family solute:Na+ symporter